MPVSAMTSEEAHRLRGPVIAVEESAEFTEEQYEYLKKRADSGASLSPRAEATVVRGESRVVDSGSSSVVDSGNSSVSSKWSEPAAIPMKIVADPVAQDPNRFRRVGGFIHDAENPTHLSWSRYCDWRKSKCPPLAPGTKMVVRRPIDQLAQATLELIGEISELQILLLKHGSRCFYDPPLWQKLVDECGDVFFCAAWAMDAWNWNLLRAMGDDGCPAILPPDVLGGEDRLREHMAKFSIPTEDGEAGDDLIQASVSYVNYSLEALSSASVHFGLTANAAKKVLFQGVPQDNRAQAESIMVGLSMVERILRVHGVPASDALARNVEKLDARFPDGWQPGGGDRSGKGG